MTWDDKVRFTPFVSTVKRSDPSETILRRRQNRSKVPMSNRILDVQIEPRSLDPVAAELIVRVRPERLTEATEVRGRLTGPSCPYASTIEIAYPLRTLERV